MTERKASHARRRAAAAAPVADDVDERAVKRSVTVRRDLNAAILDSVGARQYSAFVNEALLLALQARGIDETVGDFERAHGPLTKDDLMAAQRRRADAAVRRR